MEQTTPRRLDISQKKLQPELRAQPPGQGWVRSSDEKTTREKLLPQETTLQIESGRQRDPKESWREETHRSFYTHRGFYAEKSLHKGAFYTQKVSHREVFTLRSFLHTNVLEFLNTKSVTLGSLYTKIFNTQTRLHTETFAQRSLYAESFYTRKLLHTEKILNRRAFTRRSFSHTEGSFYKRSLYTEKTFTHKSFYTEKSLHRGAFTRSNKLKLAAIL